MDLYTFVSGADLVTIIHDLFMFRILQHSPTKVIFKNARKF